MNKLILRKKQGVYVFHADDIIYIEKKLRKINMHTADQIIEFYGKLSDIALLLDERFMYCHRSYLINMDKIVWMQRNEIYVVSDEIISFGRDTFGKAKKIFGRYLLEVRSEKR